MTNVPIGLRSPWVWIQPVTTADILSRLDEAYTLNVPVREIQNLCATAHHEITRLLAVNKNLQEQLGMASARLAYLVGGCRFAETDTVWETKEALYAAIDDGIRNDARAAAIAHNNLPEVAPQEFHDFRDGARPKDPTRFDVGPSGLPLRPGS